MQDSEQTYFTFKLNDFTLHEEFLELTDAEKLLRMIIGSKEKFEDFSHKRDDDKIFLKSELYGFITHGLSILSLYSKIWKVTEK
mgnify:CR=1 FL=1